MKTKFKSIFSKATKTYIVKTYEIIENFDACSYYGSRTVYTTYNEYDAYRALKEYETRNTIDCVYYSLQITNKEVKA